MQVALGKTEAEEHKPEVHKMAKMLSGHRGLICSDRPFESLSKYLATQKCPEFARAGNVAPEAFVLKAGPLTFQSDMDYQLRTLHLPVKLDEGTITLERDYKVCDPGDTLTS